MAQMIAGLTVAGLAAATPGHAADEFYKGKVLTIIISDPPGGGADTYARLVAQNIGRFLPGSPAAVVQSMPGASGIVATNYLYRSAPRDGTVVLMPLTTALFAPLFGNSATPYKPDEFSWIGSLDKATDTCSAWKGSGIKSFDDVLKSPVTFGAVGPAGVASEYPRAMNALFGTRIKVIHGYPGTSAIQIAMERGEIQASCAFMVSALKSAFRNAYESGKLFPIMQFARKSEELKGVPYVLDYARTEEDRQVFKLVFTRDIAGRPIVAPPKVPGGRVAELRAAFDGLVKDKAFLAGAAKAGLPIVPMSGKEDEDFVRDMMATPPAAVKRARAALEFGINENTRLTSLTAPLSAVAPEHVEVKDAAGKVRQIKLAEAAIILNGRKVKADALKVGMTCTLRFSANNMAQIVSCK
jgi:tripartite-type tricarboxylate transporter receptor subunit TctC